MAEKIKSYSFERVGGGKNRKYPWEEWLDGSIWRLKKGEDYKNASAVRNGAAREARNRGKRIQTQLENKGKKDEALVVQAVES